MLRLPYEGERTATGRFKTDEEALTKVDLPFVTDYLRMQKLVKAKSTYLEGILNETCEGCLHPSFDLNTAISYRSSSSAPNFQNVPIRNKEIGQLVRSCFVARDGNRLVEVDFGGIEVRAAAFYHKDPTMIAYLNDPTKDMHRDCASSVYLLPPEEVSKDARYTAKNLSLIHI